MKNKFTSLVVMVLLFVSAYPSSAATDCTQIVGQGEQHTTIQAGIDAAIAAGASGQTVCIRESKEYDEAIVISGVQASANAQLKIVGHPDNQNKPKIKRTAPNTVPGGNTGVFHIVDSSNIFIQNIYITYSSIIGINTFRSNRIHITDVVVEKTWQSAIRLLDTTNSIVENAYVKNAVNYASPENYDGRFWGNAVGSTNTTEMIVDEPSFVNNNTFRNIEITDSWGELLSSLRGIGDTFENNFLHHNNRVGDQSLARRIIITSLYADHAEGVTFRNNFLLFNHYNISFNDENEYGLNPRGSNRTVENNLIVGPTDGYYGSYSWPWGIMFSACEGVAPCRLENDIIRNNTIVNPPAGGVIFYNGYTDVSSVTFENNLVVPRVGGPSLTFHNTAPYNINFNHNVYTSNPVNSVGMNGGQVVDRNSIFENSSALDTSTYANEISPQVFKQNSSISRTGADVSKVGLLRKTGYEMYRGEGSPTPELTPTSTIAPTPETCPRKSQGDADCDGSISILDFSILVSEFGESGPSLRADFDTDSNVTILDYTTLITHFDQ